MNPLTIVLLIAGSILALVALIPQLFSVYVFLRYGHHISRVFEEKPLFLPSVRLEHPDAEAVELTTSDGRTLKASFIPRSDGPARGIILFCHEFLADRWLCDEYLDPIRKDGFGIFTFDFNGHGESPKIEGYKNLQWVTSHEVRDVETALAWLKSRPDLAPNGCGLFGTSKGGGAGLMAAAKDPFVKALITDGAFPTRGMMTHFIIRWVGIYVGNRDTGERYPRFLWSKVCGDALRIFRWRHRVWYSTIEWAVKRWRGPLLMIHGAKDNYIPATVIERLFATSRAEPRELWLVPKAKHNKCLEKGGAEYRERVRRFFLKHLANVEVTDPMPPATAGMPTPSAPANAANAAATTRAPVPPDDSNPA
jgi:fermentation-respiration switch protein FrsA (DUF1100 family)